MEKQLVLELEWGCIYNRPKFEKSENRWAKEMNKVKSLLLVVCAVGMALAGCASEEVFTAVEQVCVANLDRSAVMGAGEAVLGQMHFIIDKSDVEQGLIRTRPLRAAQFFEFWRSDTVGELSSAEANLHSIRRIVELEISEQSGQLCVACAVKVQRLSLPEHEEAGRSRAHKMFTQRKASIWRLEISGKERRDMAWVDLGGDKMLSTEILKRIEKSLTADGDENTEER